MQNRTLGTDLSVSAVGLGCMGFSHGYGLPTEAGETVKLLRRSLEGSLRRLGTDHIDLYFQHRIDPAVAPEEVAEGMADLIREGKITHCGISEANEDYLRRAHKVCPVTAVQNRYSMMARQYESLFPTLEELGIGFVAFSPMANGILTGQYGKGTAFAPRYDYRSSMPQFTDQAVDLAPEVIAEAVCYALAQPENVDVSDLVVRPSRER